jgi:uncharacterized protein YjiS (DUF1127 family)
MPGILSTIVLPAVTKGPGAIFWLLSTACEGTANYLGRRTAIACLHGLDDHALRDIGLDRLQIEAAVYGRITLSGQANAGIMTYPAATSPRVRQRAQTMEAASWS